MAKSSYLPLPNNQERLKPPKTSENHKNHWITEIFCKSGFQIRTQSRLRLLKLTHSYRFPKYKNYAIIHGYGYGLRHCIYCIIVGKQTKCFLHHYMLSSFYWVFCDHKTIHVFILHLFYLWLDKINVYTVDLISFLLVIAAPLMQSTPLYFNLKY